MADRGWEGLTRWWLDELQTDPAYEEFVTPTIVELVRAAPGWRVLDVGCGEGRLMHRLTAAGARPIGVDIGMELLELAVGVAPVARVRLPSMGAIRDAAFDAAAVSLVLEHLEDEAAFLAELGRVVRPGGRLALVVNHPIFTAPESAPIQEDDEVLWRPGRYFERGHTDEKAGEGTIRFYHRTMAELLNAASDGGWDLERMVEMGVSNTQVDRSPALGQQRHIPRLLGAAWRRR
ncbi:MAG: class I SAM-dependent methyltransferase [Acidimicrobiia bacterium]